MGLFSRKSKEDKDRDALNELSIEMAKEEDPKKILELNEKMREYIEDYSYFYNRGSFLSALEKIEEARDCYRKAIELNDSYVKAWYKLGHICFWTQEFENAIDAYNKVITLEKNQGKNDFSIASEFSYLITMLEILVKRLNGDLTKWKTDEQYASKIQEQLDKLRPIFNTILDPKVFHTDELIIVGCRENLGDILSRLEPDIAKVSLKL